MQHTPLASSMLASAGYENGVIEVTFKNGKTYRYQGTEELFNQMCTDESPGKFFNAHVKPYPAGSNVTAPPPPTRQNPLSDQYILDEFEI